MKKKRILIINNTIYRDNVLLTKRLLQHGYDVYLLSKNTDDPDLAVRKFDGILIRMIDSRTDDIAWLDYIKKRYGKGNIPMVLMVSDYDTGFYLRCLEKGYANFISAPCCEDRLLKRIDEIMNTGAAVTDDRVRLDLEHFGEGYSLDLPVKDMAAYLISMSDNSAAQNKTLLNFMDRSSSVNISCSNSGIIESTNPDADKNKFILSELNRAVNNNEFILYYQPVIDMRNTSLIGFESLIRWNHPIRGIISPEEFIPAAEKSDIILPIGEWIIEEAVTQLLRWSSTRRFGPDMRININLSARQIINRDLSDLIGDIIGRNGIDPKQIGFEITESAIMENMESANLTLLKLKISNHPIYMDDFGTGFSSLSYLHHFPIDTIKIDKSFVEWMFVDEQSREIVRTIIGLAHNLDMTVVAEGVETKEHMSILREYKCDYGQGYYFNRPLSPDTAEELLNVKDGTAGN